MTRSKAVSITDLRLHAQLEDILERYEEQVAEAPEERIAEAVQFLATELFTRRMDRGGDTEAVMRQLTDRLFAARQEAETANE